MESATFLEINEWGKDFGVFMRLATAELKSRDLMDDGQRRSRQSSIEDDDHLQIFCVLVARGLAFRPSVDRQEPDADLSKIWRGRPGMARLLLQPACGTEVANFNRGLSLLTWAEKRRFMRAK
jgi:hypothetical protein